MHSRLTSYLLQSKECILPGIGTLQIIHTPASTNTANNGILSPFEEIIFKTDDNSTTPGLIKYIADKKNIEQSKAEELLNDFCKEWNGKINAGEKLNFETVGSIQKNSNGVITFEREGTINFFRPISVDSVYQTSDKPVSLGRETVLPEIDQYEKEEEIIKEDVIVERSYWGLWALILLAIGSAIFFFHFKDIKLSGSTIGNQHHLTVEPPTATYNFQNK